MKVKNPDKTYLQNRGTDAVPMIQNNGCHTAKHRLLRQFSAEEVLRTHQTNLSERQNEPFHKPGKPFRHTGKGPLKDCKQQHGNTRETYSADRQTNTSVRKNRVFPAIGFLF